MNRIVNATISKAPYSTDSKWYMSIQLGDEDARAIYIFEEKYKKSRNIEKFQHSVYNNLLVVKLPFRYNKFECVVYDKDSHFSSCYELKEKDQVTVSLSHAGFSLQTNDNILSSWKTKQICVTV